METLGGIFVIILVSSDLLTAHGVSGLDLKSGTFQMLQRHPQLRKCIESVLKKNEYVGCRVSELAGQCQGLPHSWGLNPTIEQGYAYAKKVMVENSFQLQPLKVSRRFPDWKVPVVLNTGARIDISMSIPKYLPNVEKEIFYLGLNGSIAAAEFQMRADGLSICGRHTSKEGHITNKNLSWCYLTAAFRTKTEDSSHFFQMRFLDACDKIDTCDKIEIREYIEHYPDITFLGRFDSDQLPAPIRSKEKFKISLLVQPNSLVIFVEDEEVTTFKLSTHFRTMSAIKIHSISEEFGPIFVHGINFESK